MRKVASIQVGDRKVNTYRCTNSDEWCVRIVPRINPSDDGYFTGDRADADATAARTAEWLDRSDHKFLPAEIF